MNVGPMKEDTMTEDLAQERYPENAVKERNWWS
jgi:hypothetical protein